MIVLSQRDARWTQLKLGKSPLTVGRYGCTTTCISMLSDYFGSYQSPAELATKTISYTNTGLILWPSVNNIEHMSFVKRLYGRNDAEIQKSLKDPNAAVILEVDNSHWVVATGKSLFGGYKIADPWTGTRRTTGAYRKITGSAHFIRK